MLILLKILIATYIVAVNFYAFLLIYLQRKRALCDVGKPVKDKKLFFAGIIGGATGVFVSSLILKYRRDSFLTMVLMPLLIVVNAYAFITLFTGNFGFLTAIIS
jgi:uncharacterized membrane protein YsdA (DUF1294 family)